ncbi:MULTISPECIES: type II toxin-antitoxin system HicB family antitoxin [Thermodesulfovibrio]|jgi:predicted RNase H-like HicB family nuclease|uniref:Conserved domain protein n=2 Tax=Thermodesulfovibrio yellowstonii TaxID=28262 RepID=B5YKY7_THEYD|nr:MULTISPECIES: type II toxin-antitoxin system HicB family antitoxin [Thermodesulfovibrio]ACI22072.1 conserved domain protein [Thermodesulfovibrio yellowstonii DSM 11347]MDI6864155.1 type II toxin-antitoxin system HicB family antitoxin [Thermodesulfovibrio yellowstonii]GLI53629.1 HicB family protein [Thermodesulfovibrio islandicus]
MKKYSFPVIIETDEDGFFIVSCPLFKGCHSYGKTIDEALKNIREAIELCLEEAKEEDLKRYIGTETIEIPVNA